MSQALEKVRLSVLRDTNDIGEDAGVLIQCTSYIFAEPVVGYDRRDDLAIIEPGTIGMVCGYGRLVYWPGVGQCYLPARDDWKKVE